MLHVLRRRLELALHLGQLFQLDAAIDLGLHVRNIALRLAEQMPDGARHARQSLRPDHDQRDRADQRDCPNPKSIMGRTHPRCAPLKGATGRQANRIGGRWVSLRFVAPSAYATQGVPFNVIKTSSGVHVDRVRVSGLRVASCWDGGSGRAVFMPSLKP